MSTMEMKSRNPVLNREAQYAGFHDAPATATTGAPGTDAALQQQLEEMYAQAPAGTARLGIDDVVVKTAILFVFLLGGAVVGWNTAETIPLLWIGAALIGFVLAMVNVFKKQVSPPLVIAYALVQGVFLGGISYWYDAGAEAPIVQQAVLGTLVAFGVMLALYRSRIIKVDGRFQKMMLVAMVSYLVIGLASLVAALFGVGDGWGFYGVGGIGILLCVAGVGLASFTLMLDFDAIEKSINLGLPERESWRLAFGLMVTLIWLYLELLRFLAILNRS